MEQLDVDSLPLLRARFRRGDIDYEFGLFPSISQVDCGILAMGRIAQDTAVESIR